MGVPRVLYIEDNPQNRILVKRIFASAGWVLLEAGHAEEAFAALGEGPPPDLVLMDLALPGMDGYQATRRIKADPRLAGLKVVALTAHAMPGDREKAEAAGCDGYLTKPIQVASFLDSLRAFLEPVTSRPQDLAAIPALLEAIALTGELDAPGLEAARRALVRRQAGMP